MHWHLVTLRHTLSLCSPDLPWVRAIAPTMTEKYKPPNTSKSVPEVNQTPSTLPDYLSADDPQLIPAKEITTVTDTDPLTIQEKAKLFGQYSDQETPPELIIEKFVTGITYSNREREKINELTLDQSSSTAWFKYRRGMITASNFQRVVSRVNVLKKNSKSTDKFEGNDKLIRDLMFGSSFKGNEATKYGQDHEQIAADLYESAFENKHKNVEVVKTGLKLHTVHSYIGATPDRIASCSCHGYRLLEIKCPQRLAHSKMDLDCLDFLHKDSHGKLQLKQTSAYYLQVQGQMAVTDIKKCDFVTYVGATKTINIIPVAFNETFWENQCEKLVYFFTRYLAPALLKLEVDKLHQQVKDKCRNGDALQQARQNIQRNVSTITNRYPCGKCGHLVLEDVVDDSQASVGCDCSNCECNLWFHWKCVNYRPNDPEEFEEELPWYCTNCVRNCDIIY